MALSSLQHNYTYKIAHWISSSFQSRPGSCNVLDRVHHVCGIHTVDTSFPNQTQIPASKLDKSTSTSSSTSTSTSSILPQHLHLIHPPPTPPPPPSYAITPPALLRVAIHHTKLHLLTDSQGFLGLISTKILFCGIIKRRQTKTKHFVTLVSSNGWLV